MHSYFIRSNVILFFSLSTLFVLSVLNAATYYWSYPSIDIKIENVITTRFKPIERHYLSGEQAVLQFDLDAADLRPLWNWNVKQLFVWVSVRYQTKGRQYNEAVIWDRIIQQPHLSDLKEKRVRVDYYLTDVFKELRGTDVELSLSWDIQPIVGLNKRGGGFEKYKVKYTMPKKYIK